MQSTCLKLVWSWFLFLEKHNCVPHTFLTGAGKGTGCFELWGQINSKFPTGKIPQSLK